MPRPVPAYLFPDACDVGYRTFDPVSQPNGRLTQVPPQWFVGQSCRFVDGAPKYGSENDARLAEATAVFYFPAGKPNELKPGDQVRYQGEGDDEQRIFDVIDCVVPSAAGIYAKAYVRSQQFSKGD